MKSAHLAFGGPYVIISCLLPITGNLLAYIAAILMASDNEVSRDRGADAGT